MRTFQPLQIATTFLCIVATLTAFGQPFNFDSNTSGSTGILSNGWVGSPTSGFAWVALSGPTTSPGTGPSGDHTSGSGIYMYTEASTPALAGDSAFLTSPSITVTGYTTPGLSFWYHMFGAGMGDLYIDVYHNNAWIRGVDSIKGPSQTIETDPFLQKFVNLMPYQGSTIQVRFRAYCGNAFTSDIAIDDVSLVNLPAYDASIAQIIKNTPYYMTPFSQVDTVELGALVNNFGVDTITNVTLTGANGGNTYTGMSNSILGYGVDTIWTSPSIFPNTVGGYNYTFDVSIAENDTIPGNDSALYSFEISDTTYARERDNFTGGIGFTGATGLFGQMFEVFNTDTVTSIDVKLYGPTVGMSFKMKIFEYTNQPTSVIDSTDVTVIPSTDTAWYTIELGCPVVLTPGKYFFAAEQMTNQNLALAYSPEFYDPYVCWYDGGAGWTDFETAGFQVTLGIRPNFGNAFIPQLDLGSDTAFCQGVYYTIDAGNQWDDYLWSTGSNFSSITVFQSGNYIVTTTDNQGCIAKDTVVVTVNQLPQVGWPINKKLCPNDTIYLVADTDTTHTYVWNTGASTNILPVYALGQYWAEVTSAAGCVNSDTVNIIPGTLPNAQISPNPADFCEGDSLYIQADTDPAYTYIWSTASLDTGLWVSETNTYWLLVTNTDGCVASDTLTVTKRQHPTFSLGADTVICINTTITLDPGSYSTYTWNDGSTSSTLNASDSGMYWVEVFDQYGCTGSDSISIGLDSCSSGNDTSNFITPVHQTNLFKVFPNPSSHTINISVDANTIGSNLKIYSLQGVLVDEITLLSEVSTLNVHRLATGTYILSLEKDSASQRIRLMKH